MTPLLFVGVAAAGGIGAGLRYLIDLGIARLVRGRFPWGILVVNVSGSFALGVVTGAVLAPDLVWLLGTGLLGGYTTFSAVATESWLLAEEGRRGAAWTNAAATAVLCVAAASAGILLGQAV
ncbi:fluoride efflux transporter FluC [Microbacterium sp. CJ88]|uniref:fluoride efflux transporter FluC n=1 Tax=Microbacterium sp. CJ88 TaxID=3445672 RepID=UPI003F6574FC